MPGVHLGALIKSVDQNLPQHVMFRQAIGGRLDIG
jgi:hypothetical protein